MTVCSPTPSVERLSDAPPLFTLIGLPAVPSMMNVTVPVPPLGDTAAVNVTVCPFATGLVLVLSLVLVLIGKISKVNDWLPKPLEVSVTLSTNEYTPPVVGVPLTTPLLLKFNPGGSVPFVKLNV